MKERFDEVAIEVVNLEEQDIICTSCPDDTGERV